MPRPRSQEARRAVLAAAIAQVRRGGYGALTMEGVARDAGVSKQTVYRWWRSPAEVLMEALNELAGTLIPETDRGSLEADLRFFVDRTVASLRTEVAAIVVGLMAQAQIDATFGEAFRRDFLARRRAALRAVLERARERGEIDPAADLDLVAEIGFATIWYRLLSRHAPLDRRFAATLTAVLLRLCRPV